MAVPWLRLLDAALGVHDLVRARRGRPDDDADPQALTTGATSGLETRLAGVVVAALKEAFDRDTRRLELEREQLETERRRAERALKLELLRQSGDREIARLRLLSGVAAASWIVALVVAMRVVTAATPAGPRMLIGAGWLFLLGALALAFLGQSSVARVLRRAADDPSGAPELVLSQAGDVIPWLIVAGLSCAGLALLVF